MLKMITLLVCFLSFCNADLPYIITDLLPSADQMGEGVKVFSKLAEEELDNFVLASREKRFDEAYESWSALCGFFYNIQLLYFQTMSLTSNVILKGYAGNYLVDLHLFFRKSLKEKNILDIFVANGLEAAFLTPFQRDITEKILMGAPNPNDLSLEKLHQFERHNFIYEQLPINKSISVGNRLTVFTANVLCFPDNFSYFFGGVSPWPSRIDTLAKKIISTNADIICLQEIWDKEVARALIDLLKDKYFYFIYDAGNQYGTLSPEEIGFNSGLFVASRIPLENITFTPFAHIKPIKAGVKRGAIRAQFTAGNAKWTLVTTHLQNGTDDEAAQIRKGQFDQCVSLLGQDKGFILGDFNINAFSDEFESSALSRDFSIPYLDHKSSVTKETATATDYFNDLAHTSPDERPEIIPTYELLDYCVVRKDATSMKLLSQVKVPLFSIEDPTGALSDHHGILTVWKVF